MIYLEIVIAEFHGDMATRNVRLAAFLVHCTGDQKYISKTTDPKIALVYFAQAMIDRKQDGIVFPGKFEDDMDSLCIETEGGKPVQIPFTVFTYSGKLRNRDFELTVYPHRTVGAKDFLKIGWDYLPEVSREVKIK